MFVIFFRRKTIADILLPDLNHFVAPLIYDDLRDEIKASFIFKSKRLIQAHGIVQLHNTVGTRDAPDIRPAG
jgi:hypothetical protein